MRLSRVFVLLLDRLRFLDSRWILFKTWWSFQCNCREISVYTIYVEFFCGPMISICQLLWLSWIRFLAGMGFFKIITQCASCVFCFFLIVNLFFSWEIVGLAIDIEGQVSSLDSLWTSTYFLPNSVQGCLSLGQQIEAVNYVAADL